MIFVSRFPISQDTKAERVRKRTRCFLEMAMLPPEYQLPPATAASVLEAALHAHFNEEDLSSGKRYLRRLKALMDLFEPGGKKYKPAIRDVVMTGELLCHFVHCDSPHSCASRDRYTELPCNTEGRRRER